jgi:hypothetical protein
MIQLDEVRRNGQKNLDDLLSGTKSSVQTDSRSAHGSGKKDEAEAMKSQVAATQRRSQKNRENNGVKPN